MACSYHANHSVYIIDGRVTINGVKIPPCPSKSTCTTVINNKVFVGGYEWTGKQWKKTIRALWHLIF